MLALIGLLEWNRTSSHSCGRAIPFVETSEEGNIVAYPEPVFTVTFPSSTPCLSLSFRLILAWNLFLRHSYKSEKHSGGIDQLRQRQFPEQ